MGGRHELSQSQWDAIQELLPGKPGDPGRTGEDNRLFVNAVMYARPRNPDGIGPCLVGHDPVGWIGKRLGRRAESELAFSAPRNSVLQALASQALIDERVRRCLWA